MCLRCLHLFATFFHTKPPGKSGNVVRRVEHLGRLRQQVLQGLAVILRLPERNLFVVSHYYAFTFLAVTAPATWRTLCSRQTPQETTQSLGSVRLLRGRCSCCSNIWKYPTKKIYDMEEKVIASWLMGHRSCCSNILYPTKNIQDMEKQVVVRLLRGYFNCCSNK